MRAQCCHHFVRHKKGTLAVVLSDLFVSQAPISAQYGIGHKHFFSNFLAKFLLACLEQPSRCKSDTPADPDACASSSND